MNRVELIRKEEKKYHDYCYDNYKLFEKGSWLHKPVKTVIDLLPFFDGMENISVLDLGCGVGRNSIPIAEALKDRHGKVICVDLLDSAIQKLNHYSKEYKVNKIITTEKADIESYVIESNEYDLIVAVSSLGHVQSTEIFEKVVSRMAGGTKNNGVNCLIVNSEVEEVDLETNEVLDAQMEVNIPTEEMIKKLKVIYKGWKVLKALVKPLEYQITQIKSLYY